MLGKLNSEEQDKALVFPLNFVLKDSKYFFCNSTKSFSYVNDILFILVAC